MRDQRVMPRGDFNGRATLLTCVCLVFASLWSPAAAPYQPLVTDDTGTQGSGGNQLEIALNRLQSKSLGVVTRTSALSLVLMRGLTETLDMYAGSGYSTITSTDENVEARGHANPLLGLKWRFHESDERKLSIGFKPEIQFGTSKRDEARGLSTGRTGFSGVLMLTQEAGSGAIHVNYGYTRANYSLQSSRTALRSNLHRLGVAPVFELGAGWKLAFDTGVVTNRNRSARAAMGYAELGTIWALGKDLDVALGAIAFVRDGEPREFTLTGALTWRFR